MSERARRTPVERRVLDADPRDRDHASASAAIVLGAITLIGALAVLLGANFPFQPDAPGSLHRLLGGIEFVAAVALLVGRNRVDRTILFAFVGLRVVATGVLAAYAVAPAGLALVGVRCVSMAGFAACFFTPKVARYTAAAMLASYGIAVIANHPAGFVMISSIVAVGTVTGAEVFGRVVRQLRNLAGRDALTGLANRATFRDAAVREIALAERGRTPLSVALIDLDAFKVVNDTLGHLAGDALLVELAGAWQDRLRRGDLLARLGGDEFAVLLPATTPDQAEVVLARLRAAHPAAWSSGISTWCDGCDVEELLRGADRALYQAKAALPVARAVPLAEQAVPLADRVVPLAGRAGVTRG